MVGSSGGFVIFLAFHLGSRASDMRMGCKICLPLCLPPTQAQHPAGSQFTGAFRAGGKPLTSTCGGTPFLDLLFWAVLGPSTAARTLQTPPRSCPRVCPEESLGGNCAAALSHGQRMLCQALDLNSCPGPLLPVGFLPCALPFNLDFVVACSAFGVEPNVTCEVDDFPSQDRGLREMEDSAAPGSELAGWQTAV